MTRATQLSSRTLLKTVFDELQKCDFYFYTEKTSAQDCDRMSLSCHNNRVGKHWSNAILHINVLCVIHVGINIILVCVRVLLIMFDHLMRLYEYIYCTISHIFYIVTIIFFEVENNNFCHSENISGKKLKMCLVLLSQNFPICRQL